MNKGAYIEEYGFGMDETSLTERKQASKRNVEGVQKM